MIQEHSSYFLSILKISMKLVPIKIGTNRQIMKFLIELIDYIVLKLSKELSLLKIFIMCGFLKTLERQLKDFLNINREKNSKLKP